jgi:hypothetical protein
MDRVLRGKIAVRYMRHEAGKLKARKRLVAFICNKLEPDATSAEQVAQLVKDNPRLFKDEFLNPWVVRVANLRKRDPLPATFITAVQALMKATSSVIFFLSQ